MKILVRILLCGILILPASMIHGQARKFGHINSQDLLSQMPESDSAQAKIENLQQTYESTYEEMQVELNKKYENYLKNRNTYTDLIRQTKEAEITEMQQRIQQFENVASQELQTQRNELLQPIIEKANKAIKEVAEDNNFIYVFDISQGNPIYFSPESIDILPLVKAKMGLK
jgi:outer membrane protein